MIFFNRKKYTLLASTLILTVTILSPGWVKADSISDIYSELQTTHSSEMDTLIHSGASEADIQSFIGAVQSELGSRSLTESNFNSRLTTSLAQIYADSLTGSKPHKKIFTAVEEGFGVTVADIAATAMFDSPEEAFDMLPDVLKEIGRLVKDSMLDEEDAPGQAGGSIGGIGGGAVIPTPVDVEPVKLTIKNNESALVELKDTLKLTIPAGVFGTGSEIEAKVLEDKDIPKETVSEADRISQVIEITSSEKNKFQKDLELVFSLSSFKNKPSVYYYHEDRKKWMYVGGKLSSDNKEITAKINHFTKFAVFENKNPIHFSDVLSNHWAYEQVDRLAGLQIINGRGNGQFDTDSSVTRAEFAKMISLALDLSETDLKELAVFSDSNEIPAWAKGPVAAALKQGLIQGKATAEGISFEPNALISRGEMAVILSRITGATTSDITFADQIEIPSWALDGVQTVVSHGLMNGVQENKFEANSKTTRVQAAVVIGRLLHYLGL